MSMSRCTGKWKEGFNWVLLDKILTGKTRIYKRVNMANNKRGNIKNMGGRKTHLNVSQKTYVGIRE